MKKKKIDRKKKGYWDNRKIDLYWKTDKDDISISSSLGKAFRLIQRRGKEVP